MKSLAALAGAAVVALFATGCAQTANTHDTDVQAIKSLEASWNQDYASKNAYKISSYYADDAVLMVPGMDAAIGKDAIQKLIKQFLTDPALSIKFQASMIDAAKSGDMAFSQGSYTMTMTDPITKKIVTDRGSYVTVYHKQADANWKVVSDIATSAVPPPAPATAKRH